MVRSNFTSVRLSDDRTKLMVEGTSATVGESRSDVLPEILEMRIVVAKVLTGLETGSDLAPRGDQTFDLLPGPVAPSWSRDVPVLPGTFQRDDIVLLAGSAVCRTPSTSGGDGTILQIDTWLGCRALLLESDAKPAGVLDEDDA